MVVNYDEKRDFLRMKVECDVTYKLAGEAQSYSGKGTDLSADGVMFYTPNPIPEGTQMEISIHPYIKTVQPLNAKAEVMRCSKIDDGYEIGVRMFDVS